MQFEMRVQKIRSIVLIATYDLLFVPVVITRPIFVVATLFIFQVFRLHYVDIFRDR